MNPNRPAYARTTITIPRPLKRQMKAVQDSVNWSSVACQAFEAKLKELSAVEEVRTMKDVVERMRRLKKEQAGSESFQSGMEKGRHWAMNAAHPDQLERLEAFQSQHSQTRWQSLFTTEAGWREVALAIDPSSGPKHARGPGRGKLVWKRILGRSGEIADLDYFRGFAEGAIAVWKEVRDQI